MVAADHAGIVYARHDAYGPVVFRADAVEVLTAQPGDTTVALVFRSGFSLVLSGSFADMHTMIYRFSPPQALMKDHAVPNGARRPKGR